MRILITGAPKTGKTSMGIELAKSGKRHLCTDPQDLCPAGVTGTPAGLDWSACSLWVAQHWLELPGPWIVEGVAVPRALRKWRKEHPGLPPPADRLIVLLGTYEALTPRQDAMGVSLHKVLDELGEWLAPIMVIRWE